uniref:Rad60/SUMO-like domain-containing protein n=1 Tax=Kalanchoe fedtschenkoi TaxID=63787 RepID=A0A7N0UT50_KALFE
MKNSSHCLITIGFSPPISSPSTTKVEKVDKDKLVLLDCEEEEEEEEDWLPPPPEVPADLLKLGEDSTIKTLRLQRLELVSTITQHVDDTRKEISNSLNSVVEKAFQVPAEPPSERAKIVISIQDKDDLKLFRVYMDEKFEQLFSKYANKMKIDAQNLVFCFDGDKINPSATPESLGMEDDDIIEVHVKS